VIRKTVAAMQLFQKEEGMINLVGKFCSGKRVHNCSMGCCGKRTEIPVSEHNPENGVEIIKVFPILILCFFPFAFVSGGIFFRFFLGFGISEYTAPAFLKGFR
jgi:hypothetical protein|tara:strand:+ start:533 stop:841 length:309 start_codon:yes stop_codon:yes gene_type:complete